MQKGILSALAIFMTVAATSATAVPVNRSDFGPTAVNFDFTGQPNGALIATDGYLTVSGGVVSGSGPERGDLTNPTYYDGADASVIRLDFLAGAVAVGMDFNSNNADTTLSLFDSLNNLLESFTLPVSSQTPCEGFRCGFIGINFGANAVAYALIDTPLNGNELFIDNIIYQTPAPNALLLIALGLLGLGFSRRARA